MSEVQQNTVGQIVFNWWSRHINADTGSARKARAQLRRASRASDVLAMETTHNLHEKLMALDTRLDYRTVRYPLRLALIAHVTASIDNHSKSGIAVRLGRMTGDKRVMSELRFQRIIGVSDDWELAIRLRRSLASINRQANVAETGTDLFYWGEQVRNRWCFQYFGSAHPSDLASHEDTKNKKDS